jgi:hypothetical protein
MPENLPKHQVQRPTRNPYDTPTWFYSSAWNLSIPASTALLSSVSHIGTNDIRAMPSFTRTRARSASPAFAISSWMRSSSLCFCSAVNSSPPRHRRPSPRYPSCSWLRLGAFSSSTPDSFGRAGMAASSSAGGFTLPLVYCERDGQPVRQIAFRMAGDGLRPPFGSDDRRQKPTGPASCVCRVDG